MMRSSKSMALGLAAAAGAASMAQGSCPSGLDPYMGEVSPFGWPVAPAEWQFAHPECWAEKYPLCSGHRQSPMDIDLTRTAAECVAKAKGEAGALANRTRYNAASGLSVVAMSKYMRAASVTGDFGTLTLKDAHGHDVEYQATSLHLMADSLHTVNGTHADAELLVVHKPRGAPDALSQAVVVSMLFKKGAGTSALFSQLGFSGDEVHEKGTWYAPETIDLAGALAPALAKTSYSYLGSVPVPPCSESVHYVVLAAEQVVGETQLNFLKSLLNRHAGGFQKRPPVDRMLPGDICREITRDSLTVFAPETHCAEASERTAACWAETCDKSPIDIVPDATGSSGASSASDMIKYTPAEHVTVSASERSVDAAGDFGALLLNGRLFEAKKVMIKAISSHTYGGARHAGEIVVEHHLFGDSLPGHGGAHDGGHGDAAAAHHRRLEVESHHGGSHHAEEHHAEGPHVVHLSVPLKLGKENALLRELGLGVTAHKTALRDGHPYPVHGPVDLAAALAPSTGKPWVWYSGGPIAPGTCPAWGVKWMVFEEPLEVSLEQLNFLTVPVSGVDSTPLPKAVDAQSVLQAYLPEDAVELGSCEEGAGLYSAPSCWKATSPVCGSGQAQSPINVETASVSKVGAESFLAKTSWKPVSGLRLINNGNFLGFASEQLGYTTLTGPDGYPKFYQVTSVALRMPSEHHVDGKQFAAELQVVHKNQKTVLELEDDDALITSFFFDIGEESKLLKQLLPESLPATGDYTVIDKPVDLMWALGPSLDAPFYKYQGSYTEPGCAEAVQWALFEKPMTLSAEQWQAFKAFFPNPGNNRPVQPLNGRPVAKNTMEEAEPADHRFFLNREMARDRATTNPLLIIAPITGTLVLCSVMMIALFQKEDRSRKEQSAGGVDGGAAKATTYGRGYNQF